MLWYFDRKNYDREELSLVQKASAGNEEDGYKLYEHFRDYGILPGTEVALVTSCPDWLIQEYCKYRGIKSAEAAAVLIKKGNSENIKALLCGRNLVEFERKTMCAFIRFNNVEWLEAYCKRNEFHSWDQANLARYGSASMITHYYSKYHSFAEYVWTVIVNRVLRGSFKQETEKVIDLLIDSSNRFQQSRKALPLFVAKASEQHVEDLIERGKIYEKAQLSLVRRANHSLIIKFMQKHTFDDYEAVQALIRRNNEEEIELFLKKRSILENDYAVALMKVCKGENRKLLFSGKFHFSSNAEETFFRLATKEELLGYLKKHALSNEVALKLIKRGDHDLIMHYCKLSAAESYYMHSAIVKRGNHDEIMCLIEHSRFGFCAMKPLLRRGNKEEILASLKFGIPSVGVTMIIERGDTEIILAAIENGCIKEQKNVVQLIKRGNRREIEAFIHHEQVEMEIPD